MGDVALDDFTAVLAGRIGAVVVAVISRLANTAVCAAARLSPLVHGGKVRMAGAVVFAWLAGVRSSRATVRPTIS